MLIVDSQVHVWGADTPERPWPRFDGRIWEPQRSVPMGYAELLKEMDAAGVDATIIVPPAWQGTYNDIALEAVRRHPKRFGIMGLLDPTRPEAPDLLKSWRSQPGMLGLRFLFSPDLAWVEEQGASYWLWAAAEKAGVPITIAPRGKMSLVVEIARRHPGLRLSLDHMGVNSKVRGAAVFAGLPELIAAANLPNLAMKVSALPGVSEEGYPYRDTLGYLRQVYDAFGPQRMFWGTDLTRLPCSYSLAVSMFTEEIPWLKGEELELVMGKAVCRWLDWPLTD